MRALQKRKKQRKKSVKLFLVNIFFKIAILIGNWSWLQKCMRNFHSELTEVLYHPLLYFLNLEKDFLNYALIRFCKITFLV